MSATPITFRQGFWAPLQAVPFILARPRLLLLATTPLVINLMLFLAVATLLSVFVGTELSDRFFPGQGKFSGVARTIMDLLLTVVIVLCSAFVAFLLISPVAAPFNDLISERVEKELLADRPDLAVPERPWTHNMRHAVFETLQRVFISLPIFIVTVAVGLVPFCGPPLALLIIFLNAMYFLAVDAYSYSLDRRGVKLRGKFRYLGERKPLWYGLGTGLTVILVIPCNLLFLPMIAAVAGTRLYCAERRSEAPPALT